MEKQILYEGFIKNFIVKERRERCLFELTTPGRRNEFINRLNHQTRRQFIMEKLLLIPKKVELYQFVIDHLKVSKTQLCYVFSSDEMLDDKFIGFKQAFDNCYETGEVSLIITTTFDKLYLIEEQGFGPPNRFVGKA